MQDAPLQRAFYYRANGGNGFALINSDGTFTRPGDAYEAVASLNSTPLRLATTGGDTSGLAVAAGRSWSADGEIRVLISNYGVPDADQGLFPPFIVNNDFSIPGIGTFTLLPRRTLTYANNDGYDLTVNNIHGGQSGVLVRRYRIDGNDNLSLVDSAIQRGSSVHLTATSPAPSAELVVISPARGGRDG
jgi:hypothetical protein